MRLPTVRPSRRWRPGELFPVLTVGWLTFYVVAGFGVTGLMTLLAAWVFGWDNPLTWVVGFMAVIASSRSTAELIAEHVAHEMAAQRQELTDWMREGDRW